MPLIDRNDSFLLIVDVQEKLAPAVIAAERVVGNAGRLITAAQRLSVPVFLTEHCPSRIGPALRVLRGRVSEDAVLEKAHFSVSAEPRCAARLAALDRRQCVIAGMEAHVCVLQAALGLVRAGYRTFVVSDAVSSRNEHDRQTALRRMRDEGVMMVTTEMIIFEWLERGDAPEFRDLLPVIKNRHESINSDKQNPKDNCSDR